MRSLSAVACVAVAAWLGSVLGGCLSAAAECESRCRSMPGIAPATLRITSSSRPELVGGEVEIQSLPRRVIVRYADQQLVFSGTLLH
jgi:hypothetical protein